MYTVSKRTYQYYKFGLGYVLQLVMVSSALRPLCILMKNHYDTLKSLEFSNFEKNTIIVEIIKK